MLASHVFTMFSAMWITFRTPLQVFLTSVYEMLIFVSRKTRTAHMACG